MLRRSTVFLAKVILLLNVSTSAENISVNYKGTECPCLSYYTPPNYDCLLEELENNRTLPSLCLHILQAMDSGHKFRIIKTHSLDCGTQRFYQYRHMEFTIKTGRKIYVQKNICKSRFENPSVFQIWTPRKEFFQVVARNLELLDLGDISCSLNAVGLYSNFTCKDWNASTTYYFPIIMRGDNEPKLTLAISESFSLKDGLINSTGAITYRNSFLHLGFLNPDPNVDQLSPGSFVMNKPQMSHTYIGHLLRFSCQWGHNSYQASTRSCIKDRYASGVGEPSAEEKIEKKFSSRAWNLTLRLNFQRVFKNTIVIQLHWKLRDQHTRLKKFETVCRVFDAHDHTYQPGACVSCWEKQRNCSECWDMASFDGHLSPSFHLRSSNYYHYYAYVQRTGNMTIILQTNHQNISFENGSFHTNPNISRFYNIFQYDYIFGSYSAYMPEGRKAEKRSNTHQGQEQYLSSSVFLPGQQKIPTDLSPQQVHSLSTICRVRCVFTDNSVSEFSNPVWTTFSKNIFPTAVLVFKPYHRVEPLKIIKSGDRWKVIDREDLFQSQSYPKLKLDSRIFSNKLFDNEYMFSTVCVENSSPSCSSSSTKYRLNYADEKSRAMKPSDVYADSEPLDRKCASLHRFLLWTEKGEAKEIRLFQVYLENESGKPLSSKKTVLNGERLCGCSSHKSITSPSFDLVYRNMDNPQSVEVAVVCGDVICLYDLNIHQSSKLPFSLQKMTVANMAMDQNFVILVREDKCSTHAHRKVVLIVPITYNGSVHSLPHGYNSTGRTNITMLQIQAIHPPVHLPIPPKHCMEPFINPDHTTVKMSDNSTIFIEVTVSWDNAPECDMFLRPSVAVSIVYAKVPSYMILREYPGMRCASIQGLECKKLPTSIFRGPSSFTSAITEVLRDKYYLIDISVSAAFDQQTYDIWYAGSPTPEGQTLANVISTEYTETPDYVWIIVAAAVTILLVLLVTGIFYWSYMRKMYMYKHLNRISAKDIKKEEKIGEGNFGQVWKATLGKQTIVLKMLKESATDREEKEFREEALLLSKFNSDYIVRAVGICLQSRPIMLGLEFVNGGSLNKYLKRDDVRSKLHAVDMFQIAEQALRGCVYLEHEGYIHRDIAARNCLVATTSDANLKPKCVKLSDFGMAKDTGAGSVYKSRDPDADTLPIAWTAPEAFRGKFSTKTDVWAFGILIWEIFTWAATPYGECSDTSKWHICPISTLSHEEIEFKVCAERKNLLNFPDPCTAVLCSALKDVIGACLQFAADERSSFLQLQKFLSAAKAEVLKMDIQMCFKKSANLPQKSQGSSADPPVQATTIGNKKRFVHDAYRDAEEHHHKENPFNKDVDFSGEIGSNEEAIEILPHIKLKQRMRDAYKDAAEEDHQKENSFNKDDDFSGEMGNEEAFELLPQMKQKQRFAHDVYRDADEDRFAHDVYRDADEDHHKKNSFNKDDNFSSEIRNEEAVGLLPLIKQV